MRRAADGSHLDVHQPLRGILDQLPQKTRVIALGDQPRKVDVETLGISDESMVIAGSFAGQLIQGGADELVLDDDVPSITIDGNYQAKMPRLDSE